LKLQVLVDNNTFIDSYYYGEPAVSYYIEMDDKRILFDTGYSDVMIKNAHLMGIELSKITHIVLSHGHNDHSRGLKYLSKSIDLANVKLIAHPHCFFPKQIDGEDIGAPYNEDDIAKILCYQPQITPLYITDNCCFLGQIPRVTDFESKHPIGTITCKGQEIDDFLYDDTALVCNTSKGLFIITGCSHSGICNIIDYAKKQYKNTEIAGVIGGFHLLEVNKQLSETVDYLKKQEIKKMYPCHCVSLHAKAKLIKEFNVEEVGVGLTIEL